MLDAWAMYGVYDAHSNVRIFVQLHKDSSLLLAHTRAFANDLVAAVKKPVWAGNIFCRVTKKNKKTVTHKLYPILMCYEMYQSIKGTFLANLSESREVNYGYIYISLFSWG